jgi:hypothetical protein
MAQRRSILVRIALFFWHSLVEGSPVIGPATVEPNSLTDEEGLPRLERNLDLPCQLEAITFIRAAPPAVAGPSDASDLSAVLGRATRALEDRVRLVPECIQLGALIASLAGS